MADPVVENHLRWVLARMTVIEKEEDVIINGHRCFVEIERNIYLPATEENIAKAKQARFLEALRKGEVSGVVKDSRLVKREFPEDKCSHIVWWDDPNSVSYISRNCAHCGICIEMI